MDRCARFLGLEKAGLVWIGWVVWSVSITPIPILKMLDGQDIAGGGEVRCSRVFLWRKLILENVMRT
jgi:hypothetical protein